MRTYAALAEEKYDLPIYPVLVNILLPAATVTIPDCFESTFLGILSYQGFRVINLWELEAAIVFEQSLNALLPFVPILKQGGAVETVQQALTLLRQDEQLVELESLLAFFASFVLESDVVRQIMRWDMTVLRESPWYQEILREGERQGEQRGLQKGRQEGIQEGRQEGRQEGEQLLIVKQLTRRFGVLPADLAAKIQSLSVEQLEGLGESLLDFTQLEDLITWLNRQA